MTTATYLDTLFSEMTARIDYLFPVSPPKESAKSKKRKGEEAVRKETCEVCGYDSKLGFLIDHHIVSEYVIRQMRIADSRTVKLCKNCHSEVHTWYLKKVFSIPYDAETKRFKPKLPIEMVKEYEAAYEGFAEHKKAL